MAAIQPPDLEGAGSRRSGRVDDYEESAGAGRIHIHRHPGRDCSPTRVQTTAATTKSKGTQTPMNIRDFIQRILVCGLALVATDAALQTAAAKEPDAVPDAIEAYIYGYPLVTMEITRRVMTNVDKP